MARELDDAILTCVRANWIWLVDFQTAGNPGAVSANDEFILKNQDNWFVREVWE